MQQATIAKTLKRQRAALIVEPIHATVDPVRRYAAQLAEMQGKPFHVVTIPEGSSAYNMGYRFVSIPDEELPHYVAGGCTKV